MLYKITTSTVEMLEQTITKHVRRWLGVVPRSFTSIGLYVKTKQLQLHNFYLSEEFKVTKSRMVVTLKQSTYQSTELVLKPAIE